MYDSIKLKQTTIGAGLVAFYIEVDGEKKMTYIPLLERATELMMREVGSKAMPRYAGFVDDTATYYGPDAEFRAWDDVNQLRRYRNAELVRKYEQMIA